MLKLVIKFVLILLGLYIVRDNLPAAFIAGLLCAISASGLNQFFENKNLSITTFIVYCVVCAYMPEFALFLPIVAFDLLINPKKRILALVLPLPTLFAFTYSINFGTYIVILLAVTGVLAYVFTALTNSRKAHTALRDSYEEASLLLIKKNEELLDGNAQNMHSATLQERNRIARDIHDNVGHSLTRSILQIAAIKTLNKDGTLNEHLNSLQTTLNKAMSDIRTSVHDLNHASIDLQRAVKNLFNELSPRLSNVAHTLTCDIAHNAPSDVKYCFLTVIKEALTNITKHSNANEVKIILQEHPAIFQLVIHDNGTTFISRQSGMGLDSIKTRVDALKGRCSFSHANGFKIFISIPK